MIKFEDPFQFNIKKESGGLKIVYSDLVEVCQGGPEIGNLSINERSLDGFRFGGPCLMYSGFVYAPAYIKDFFGSGFKLSKINSYTLELSFLGNKLDFIYLDKIENRKIYFFEDINKTISSYVEII